LSAGLTSFFGVALMAAVAVAIGYQRRKDIKTSFTNFHRFKNDQPTKRLNVF